MTRLRPTIAFAALALAAVLASTACTSVPDRVQSALDSASSATASASTALQLLDEGRALPALTDTILGDALTELGTAESDLSQAGALGDQKSADQRDAALASIRAATDAILAAREIVASGGDLGSDVDRIQDVTRVLHAQSESLGT